VSEPILKVEELSKVFQSSSSKLNPLAQPQKVMAVDSVSFDLMAGETLALVGESGCGKSTMGRLILRLLEASEGRVLFKGQDIGTLNAHQMRALRSDMQMVFQDPYGSLNPRMTVGQIISEPMMASSRSFSKSDRRDRAHDLLKRVGLPPEAIERFPRQFSGGQRQRIGIARAIALNPSFIVADEPVSALDVSIQAQIVNLLQDLQDELGVSYVFISHDLSIVRHIADRIAVMYLGRIVEMGTRDEVFESPRHPYTEALMSATPSHQAAEQQERIVLRGDVPSPTAIPSGCSFRTRCPLAQPICATERPPLVGRDGSHAVACHFARPFPVRASGWKAEANQ
jgi:oligopeptide/dipeptide ABC transporter ATP-binding protein